jgi:hypothetical protein
MVKQMLGVADIAAMFGVEPKTVSMWRLRYPDLPEPDVSIGDLAGWDPRRKEEIRAWYRRRPGQGRRTVPDQQIGAVEALRWIFVHKFMRPNDYAWAPIDFPGIIYDADGVLADDMQERAAAHLMAAIRAQGYDIAFDDPATDTTDAVRRILWDKWTEADVGENRFIGRLFSDRGQIYPGCTAFDAATYTLERLNVLGGELRLVR